MVVLSVAMKCSPGITALALQVDYGEELTLTEISEGDMGAGMFMMPSSLKSPASLIWVLGVGNVYGDHVVAKLSFQVSGDAKPGFYPVTLSYDPDDIYSVDMKTYAEENVAFQIVGGGIYVETAVDACAHSFGEYTSNQDADCLTDGTKHAFCRLCGQEDVVADLGSALGHDFSLMQEGAVWQVRGSGENCKDPVRYYYSCSRCGMVGSETFTGAPGPHILEEDWTQSGSEHFRACSVEGCNYRENLAPCFGGKANCVQGAVCEICGGVYSQPVPCVDPAICRICGDPDIGVVPWLLLGGLCLCLIIVLVLKGILRNRNK